MPAEQLHVEFVGGPIDGHHRVLPDEPESWECGCLVNGKIEIHKYRRRRVNGIAPRLPSGLFPMDWSSKRPAEESQG